MNKKSIWTWKGSLDELRQFLKDRQTIQDIYETNDQGGNRKPGTPNSRNRKK